MPAVQLCFPKVARHYCRRHVVADVWWASLNRLAISADSGAFASVKSACFAVS